MIAVKKFLFISIVFTVLLISFAAAQSEALREAKIKFQLLEPPVRNGLIFIGFFISTLVLVFATAVSRSSPTSMQNAWAFIVISTIFLSFMTINQVLWSIRALQIEGLGNILHLLFIIFLLIGLYKLRQVYTNRKANQSGQQLYSYSRFK